jgi:hypothetical protein
MKYDILNSDLGGAAGQRRPPKAATRARVSETVCIALVLYIIWSARMGCSYASYVLRGMSLLKYLDLAKFNRM